MEGWKQTRYRLYSTLGLIPFTTASHAAVFDSDDRIVAVTEQHIPYSPIGVASPMSGLGSWFLARYMPGFLVNNCHAMTVKHLLGGTESPVGKMVRFTAGFTAITKEKTHGIVGLAGGLEYSQGEAAYESARSRLDAYKVGPLYWSHAGLCRPSACAADHAGEERWFPKLPV